jgi:photosystem II stability/assembly factor-like uncharacterized protein
MKRWFPFLLLSLLVAGTGAGAVTATASRSGWVREAIPSADVKAIAFHPLERGLLLAGTNAGEVYRSEDGGQSWRVAGVDLPFPGGVVNRIVADPRIPRRFYAATWNLWSKGGGVWATEDAGESWRRLPGLPDAQFRAVATAPGAPFVVVVGGEAGVWQSEDAGGHFVRLTPRKPEWTRVESLAFDPRTPLTIYAGTWRRAFRSDDGGRKWHPIWNGMIEDTDVFSLNVSPAEPETIWATTCGWVYRTPNRGGKWERRTSGFRNRRVHGLTTGEAGWLYAATCLGVHRSCDGGDSWDLSGLRDETIADIRSDPFDPMHLVVAVENDGIWSSSDGGDVWVRSSGGLAGAVVLRSGFSSKDGRLRAEIVRGNGTEIWERSETALWGVVSGEASFDEPECWRVDEFLPTSPVAGLPARKLCRAPASGFELLLTAGAGLWSRSSGTAHQPVSPAVVDTGRPVPGSPVGTPSAAPKVREDFP